MITLSSRVFKIKCYRFIIPEMYTKTCCIMVDELYSHNSFTYFFLPVPFHKNPGHSLFSDFCAFVFALLGQKIEKDGY